MEMPLKKVETKNLPSEPPLPCDSKALEAALMRQRSFRECQGLTQRCMKPCTCLTNAKVLMIAALPEYAAKCPEYSR